MQPLQPFTEQSPSKRSYSPYGFHWMTWLAVAAFLALVGYKIHKISGPYTARYVNISALGLTTLNGKPLAPSSYAGKAVILNYWAPWCGPCQLETPWLQRLQSSHPHDLVVIGVVADQDQYPQAQTFMEKQGASYPLVRDTAQVDSGMGDVSELPTSFYINSSGKIVRISSGLIPEFMMRRYVKVALNN